MTLRKRFFNLIVRKLAKIEYGVILPKWAVVLRWVLFPISTYLFKQSMFNFDIYTLCFKINGYYIREDKLFELVAEHGEKI